MSLTILKRPIFFVTALFSMIFLAGHLYSEDVARPQPVSLTLLSTLKLPLGTHRPEIIIDKKSGDIFLVVIQPQGQKGAEGSVKHRAYRYAPDGWRRLGTPFTVTRTTNEFGEPSDHRAVIVRDKLIVVYQTNKWRVGRRDDGPAEDYSSRQSLMMAVFSLEGEELERSPIVANVTDFSKDNFPDHCIRWWNNRLLISTGTRSDLLKIREVDIGGSILSTRKIIPSEITVPAKVGNSFVGNIPAIQMVSFTGPDKGSLLSLITLNESLSIKNSVLLAATPGREQHFPVSSVNKNGYIFICYISRPNPNDPFGDVKINPYSPYLKILDGQLNVVLDVPLGKKGFGRVHPTLAIKGNTLYVAWSQQVRARRDIMPRVVIDEYSISFER